MRFLLGFVSGIVAMVALGHAAQSSRYRASVKLRNPAPSIPIVSQNLARYYRVSLN
jgi:hypothetical protein